MFILANLDFCVHLYFSCSSRYLECAVYCVMKPNILFLFLTILLQVTADQVTFCNLGGLTALTRVLLVPDIASDKPAVKPIIPNK